jgi:hypothetical protein
MNLSRLLAAGLLSIGLFGCASKPIVPVGLDRNFYNDQKSTVGVLVVVPEKSDTYLDGASCLLCYAVASTANSSLTSHINTLPTADMANVKTEVIGLLKGKGKNADLVSTPVLLDKLKGFKSKETGFAEQDYRVLKQSLGVDKLLLVNLTRLGAQRSYSDYIPTSDPQGAVAGTMLLVDLTTNKLELYKPLNILVPVQGEWDEPKQFPGVTNAYYQAIEKAKSFVKEQLN